MYAICYPLSNSAALGLFSKLQKSGRQAQAQSQNAFMGSLARVIMPVVAGYFEEYVKSTSCFSLTLFMMALSIIVVVWNQNKILHFTTGKAEKDAPLESKDRVIIFLSLLAMIASIFAMINW
jgi:MFS family permease